MHHLPASAVVGTTGTRKHAQTTKNPNNKYKRERGQERKEGKGSFKGLLKRTTLRADQEAKELERYRRDCMFFGVYGGRIVHAWVGACSGGMCTVGMPYLGEPRQQLYSQTPPPPLEGHQATKHLETMPKTD